MEITKKIIAYKGRKEYSSYNGDSNSRTIISNVTTTGGGGSTVAWNQILSAGTQIAQITINGTQQNVYALSGNVTSTTCSILWTGTQAQYDAITTKDPNTLYIITD